MRQRLAEFRGAEQLSDAAAELLATPTLDAVVVHEVDAVLDLHWQSGSADASEVLASNIALLYDAVPAFKEVDETCEAWWNDNPIASYSFTPQLGYVFRKDKGTGSGTFGDENRLHVDSIHHGVLTASIRVDTNAANREFFAYRPNIGPTLDQQGYNSPNYDAVQQQLHKMTRRPFWYGKYALTRIVQMPGDCIMFSNHPYPAIHGAVQQREANPRKAAQAIVAGYSLKANETSLIGL